jgi:hypothetical protein
MIEISARKLDDQRLLFGIERAPKFQPRWGKTSQSKT